MGKKTQSPTSDWQAFPHANDEFRHDTHSLKTAWPKLHKGDCEPFPTPKRIKELEPDHPDPQWASEALIEAWCDYHAGDFGQAIESAQKIGLLAHAVANKASGIYADYLEDDASKQMSIYQAGMERAQGAMEAFPHDPNSYYFHAFMTGRYSQCISVAKALKDGLAGRVKSDVLKTLELAPKHAEGWLALGLFHAEVINKVGKMVGGMTYGASATESMSAFDKALALTPNSPIAWIEYGNALYLLYGDKKLDESNEAYLKASQLKPLDAMQKLDVEYAINSLAQ